MFSRTTLDCQALIVVSERGPVGLRISLRVVQPDLRMGKISSRCQPQVGGNFGPMSGPQCYYCSRPCRPALETLKR